MKRFSGFKYLLFAFVALCTWQSTSLGMIAKVGEEVAEKVGGKTAREATEAVGKAYGEQAAEAFSKLGLKEETFITKEMGEQIGKMFEESGFTGEKTFFQESENITKLTNAKTSILDGLKTETTGIRGFGEFDEAALKDMGGEVKTILEKNSVKAEGYFSKAVGKVEPPEKLSSSIQKAEKDVASKADDLAAATKNLDDARLSGVKGDKLKGYETSQKEAVNALTKADSNLGKQLEEYVAQINTKYDDALTKTTSATEKDAPKVEKDVDNAAQATKTVTKKERQAARTAAQKKIEDVEKVLRGKKSPERAVWFKNKGRIGELDGEIATAETKLKTAKTPVETSNAENELAKARTERRNLFEENQKLQSTWAEGKDELLSGTKATRGGITKGKLLPGGKSFDGYEKIITDLSNGKVSINQAIEQGAVKGESVQGAIDRNILKRSDIEEQLGKLKNNETEGVLKENETVKQATERLNKDLEKVEENLKTLKETEEKISTAIKNGKFDEANAAYFEAAEKENLLAKQPTMRDGKTPYTKTGLKDEALAERKNIIDENKINEGVITNQKSLLGEAEAELEGATKFTDDPVFWTKTQLKNLSARVVIDGVLMASAFALISQVGQAIAAGAKKAALLKTIQTPQKFGGIWMEIPDQLVNINDPIKSLPIYMGMQYKGSKRPQRSVSPKLTGKLKYYMEQPQFGSPNTLTSASFGGKMLSLTTGDYFISDGSPVAEEAPTIPIVTPVVKGTRNLTQTLAAKAGKVRTSISEVEPTVFGAPKGGYAGSADLADLMTVKANFQEFSKTGAYPALAKTDYKYPALLNVPIARALEKDVVFANRKGDTVFTVRQVRALNQKQLITMMEDVAELIGKKSIKNSFSEGNFPFGLLGTYVYETADTQLAKNMRDSLGYRLFKDYVVFLNAGAEQVPLYVPQQRKPYNYYSYQKNSEIQFMKSLIDGSVYEVASGDGHVVGSQQDQTLDKFKNKGALPTKGIWNQDLSDQLASVKLFVDKAYQYGPFQVGGKTLQLSESWQQQGVYIYKISNTLTGKVDDYVFGLKTIPSKTDPKKSTFAIAKLPDDINNVFQYWSVVTSRCYDGNMQPWKSPDYSQLNYAITDSGRTFYAVSKADLAQQLRDQNLEEASIKLQGSTERYTVYMDADVNPIDFTQLGDTVVQSRSQIAFTKMMNAYAQMADENGATYPNMTMAQMPATVKAEINKAWGMWSKAYKDKVFDAKTRLAREKLDVGPFAFVNAGKQDPTNIYITATNEANVENEVNVYTSATYPLEFLAAASAVGKTADDVTFAFGPYSNERYMISITRGFVYDNQQQGEPIAKLDPVKVWNKLKSFYSTNGVDLAQVAANTSAVIERKLKHAVRDARENEMKSWGSWRLYSNETDQASKQYIYGDISDLPIDQVMNATRDELEGTRAKAGLITDWLICGEYKLDSGGKPQRDANGNPLYSYGKKFDNEKTKIILSLVTLVAYNNQGDQIFWFGNGTAQQDMLERGTKASVVPADYLKEYTALLGLVAKTAGVSIKQLRLYPKFSKLMGGHVTQMKEERAEIVKAQQEAENRTPMLDVSIQELLKTKPEPEIPGMMPRDLRKAKSGKYYQVIPAQPKDTDFMYITDYNVATQTAQDTTDTKRGYVYEIAPAAVAQRKAERGRGFGLVGEALVLARGNVGIKVAADGKQTLGVGFENPNIAVSDLLAVSAKEANTYDQKITTLEATKAGLAKKAAEGKALSAKEQEQLNQINKDLRVYEAALDSSKAIVEADKAKLINRQLSAAGGMYAKSTAKIDDFYINKATHVYYVKITDGKESYYLDLLTGDVYDVSTGRPRVRPVNLLGKSKVANQILVNTKDAKNVALLRKDASGLIQLEFQHPKLKGAAGMASQAAIADRTVSGTTGNKFIEYALYSSVKDQESGAIATMTINLKEDPVDQQTLEPDENTVYTISEKTPGFENFAEVGQYKYDSSNYFSNLIYYNTRTGGKDKYFITADQTKLASTFFIWDGTEARTFKMLNYQNQLVNLTKSGNNYTGTVYDTMLQEDENGIDRLMVDKTKTRQITVKKALKTLPMNLTEDIVTIVDGGNEYDFHYTTQVIANLPGFVRDITGLSPIVDAQGINRLVYSIGSLKGLQLTGKDILNSDGIPEGTITQVNTKVTNAKIVRTKNKKHLLYPIQEGDFNGKFVGWYVDLMSGVLYDAFGTPLAAITQVQLLEILFNLGVKVQLDLSQIPQLVYRR